MAISMRSKLASPVARSAPRAAVVVRAEKGSVQAVQLAAASVLSAVALLTASAADAKVIIAQPQLKKAFFDDSETVVRPAPTVGIPGAARPAPSVAEPAKPRVADSNNEGGVDPRIISLPGAIVAIGGLGFLATKVDPGVTEWFDDVIVKSNIDDGVGYEPVLKPADGQLKPAAGVYAAGNSGTKKAQATKKGPSVAGGLGAFFGKK